MRYEVKETIDADGEDVVYVWDTVEEVVVESFFNEDSAIKLTERLNRE